MWADVDRVEILPPHYSRLLMIPYADATLVGELLSVSVYTVHAITYDGSCLTHFMTTATLIMYN